MSAAPIKKLPASPRVSSPGVPVANRGGEEVNIGFSDCGAGSRDKLRDPRARRSAGNDRKFRLGNEFHMGPEAAPSSPSCSVSEKLRGASAAVGWEGFDC